MVQEFQCQSGYFPQVGRIRSRNHELKISEYLPIVSFVMALSITEEKRDKIILSIFQMKLKFYSAFEEQTPWPPGRIDCFLRNLSERLN